MSSVSYYSLRLVKEKEIPYEKLGGAKDIYNILKELGACESPEEYSYVFCIDSGGNIVGVSETSHGAGNIALVDCKAIMRRALLCNANNLVVAHNHPSGTLEPSKPDIETTNQIKEAAALLGFRFLDHIIVTRDGYISVKEKEREKKKKEEEDAD